MRERKARDMRGKGLGLICHFLNALRARGVPVLTGQQVDRLAVEDKRVTGVIMASGERITARKGVIIGTGGYSANAQMSRDFEQIPGIDQEPRQPVARLAHRRRPRLRRRDRRHPAQDREQPAGDALLHHSAG